MRASIYYFALAGLQCLSQASPIADPDPPTDPRALITRSSETLRTKRQATTPPAEQQNPAAGIEIINATRNVTLAVEKGDTLGQIAKLLNSGICQIAQQNNIADPNFIQIGQMLTVTINIQNPDNDSCINRGGSIGSIPPVNNNSTAADGGKKAGEKGAR
ncbi:hypothetical protein LY78DRAFT_729770 [Colletotrichum sublineola]|uniref:Putative intracellular hyphae protein 1 n=1 Tax=Colletotrichum sublineola TaxID=1173701 RepID=A0A066XAG3_COLSU|nr:hypothetical protein LY78DRAFT_729770 [Colletotrichum sublineola]KDN63020.1 putative intracellular hyphae protein 1 [Colletotrichum sublineola]